ncbi:MAG: NAD kinase [Candidatus Methylophosphatis roskildensis]|jgi:NAD+ kinase|uniref:NAD kinase n=1 Tax=Candidatus Methylophosphatis roskildensis TaxID=2899263 RepID=A0A9D7ED15_9PROT|nr:NAD kinase [Candidatus Methylophosphatis roskildensis]MBK7235409.1 NAD kinase [Sterolibacteriaceae bacterium]MBK7663471.1 NAD kinase [Sterolibacteriaceae bacterium]MBK9083812.1 NAD kinase [Sterolibacteriaceae bacterium]
MSPGGFRTIAVIGKYQAPEVTEALLTLIAYLRGRDLDVLVERDTAAAADAPGFEEASYEEIAGRADMAIVIGGDGTMLATARRLAASAVPLVGINQGRLGFMTDIARDEMTERIGELLDGRYRRETRILLEAAVRRDGRLIDQALALNDVVLNKGDAGRMIEFEVTIDGEFIYNQRSDGFIVATPTGSTAYALSANGPILQPAVAGIALVPLCPHALTARPITVSETSVIDIRVTPQYDARLYCDGQTHIDLAGGDEIRVARSRHAITLLHPESYSYFAMLREKLRWSEAPRYPS